MQKAQQIKRLEQQKRNCPSGSAGNSCRSQMNNQIKAIQEELKEKARQLAEQHNVPVNE